MIPDLCLNTFLFRFMLEHSSGSYLKSDSSSKWISFPSISVILPPRLFRIAAPAQRSHWKKGLEIIFCSSESSGWRAVSPSWSEKSGRRHLRGPLLSPTAARLKYLQQLFSFMLSIVNNCKWHLKPGPSGWRDNSRWFELLHKLVNISLVWARHNNPEQRKDQQLTI